MRRTTLLLLLAGTTAWATACVGNIGDPEDPPKDSDTSHTEDAVCEGIRPGPAPIRRLTRREYDATVRDLLHTSKRPAQGFPADEEAQGFDNNAGLLGVSQILADRYMEAAEELAIEAAAAPEKVLPCDPAGGEDACAKEFIQDFGARAFRRPLTTEEAARFFDLYTSGKPRGGFQKGIQLVVHAALMSPYFLYRVEVGAPEPSDEGVVKLSHHEVATRLSYLLWGTMPDKPLFDLAAAGKLGTPEEVSAQARAMLDDDRAKAVIADFHAQWLEIDDMDELTKDSEIYPAFNETVRTAMGEETERFIEYVLFEGDGKLETLFTADYTFMNKTLADFHGVTGPEGDGFEMVSVDPAKRPGLLGHASFLSMHAHHNQTSPVFRGKFVRERLFCETLPDPPPNLVIMPPEVEEGVTTREKFKQHSADAACSGCHKYMDPVGFGFENFDGIGRWRDQEYDIAVDASGEVVAMSEGAQDDASTGTFTNLADLSGKLAQSELVRSCLITNWFRYGYGRSETQDDSCTMADLKAQFEDSGHDVRELLVALTRTDAFLYRRAVASEGGSP